MKNGLKCNQAAAYNGVRTIMIFMLVPNFLGSITFGALNFSGTKKLRESNGLPPNEIEDHFRTSRYLKDSLVSEKHVIFNDQNIKKS